MAPHPRYLIPIILLLSGLCLPAAAQQSVPAAAPPGGSYAAGSTFEYFISEAMNQPTLASADLVVIPGLLRSSGPAGNGHIPQPLDGLEVYPSPVAPTLYVKPHTGRSGHLFCKLFNSEGDLVWNEDMTLVQGDELVQAAVAGLAKGEYTLLIRWGAGPQTRMSAYRVLKVR